MRISDINAQHFSITWFGVDKAGRIVAFRALGEGNIPEFVKRSEEETTVLFHYFYGCNDWDFSKCFDFRSKIDETVFAVKGLFVCVANDPYEYEKYNITQRPQKPLFFSELPSHIQQIMQTHILNTDIENSKAITIE